MKELLKEELEQLASYADNIEECELYYGNKEEFQKRHKQIKIYLYNLIHKDDK